MAIFLLCRRTSTTSWKVMALSSPLPSCSMLPLVSPVVLALHVLCLALLLWKPCNVSLVIYIYTHISWSYLMFSVVFSYWWHHPSSRFQTHLRAFRPRILQLIAFNPCTRQVPSQPQRFVPSLVVASPSFVEVRHIGTTKSRSQARW